MNPSLICISMKTGLPMTNTGGTLTVRTLYGRTAKINTGTTGMTSRKQMKSGDIRIMMIMAMAVAMRMVTGIEVNTLSQGYPYQAHIVPDID